MLNKWQDVRNRISLLRCFRRSHACRFLFYPLNADACATITAIPPSLNGCRLRRCLTLIALKKWLHFADIYIIALAHAEAVYLV